MGENIVCCPINRHVVPYYIENAVKDTLVAWAHPDDGLSGPGGFDEATASAAVRGVPPVTPDAFDPRALGARPVDQSTNALHDIDARTCCRAWQAFSSSTRRPSLGP